MGGTIAGWVSRAKRSPLAKRFFDLVIGSRLEAPPQFRVYPPTVLHIITRFARGGSEQRVLDVIGALPERNHVLAVGDLTAADRLDAHDVEFVRVRRLHRSLAPVSDLRAALGLRRLIRRVRPETVITHQSKAGVLGRLACWAAGSRVRVVHSLSMSPFEEATSAWRRVLYRRAENLLAPCTDLWICVGQDVADQYAEQVHLPPERMHVVRSSLDLGPFMPCSRAAARSALDLPDQPTVLYVGSFEERKGVETLPALFRGLVSSLGACTALLVGDGPLRGAVAASVGGIPGVTQQAPGHSSDVHRFMQAADALCLPSRAEGLPQVLVQAAAVGLPFVSYDTCGSGELVALGARGTLVPRGDVDAMIDALRDTVRDGWDGPHIDRTKLADWDEPAVRDAYRTLLLPAEATNALASHA
jgi:glycosyltransferase involved in cell wall biosynthesis